MKALKFSDTQPGGKKTPKPLSAFENREETI